MDNLYLGLDLEILVLHVENHLLDHFLRIFRASTMSLMFARIKVLTLF